MTPASALAVPPKLPVSLAANPKLSSWIKFSREGQVTRLARQGRDRPRHRHGAGADRRRRTRCRYRPRPDGPRFDRRQPQRGRHLGQSFGAAFRPRDPPCLRRNPPDLSRLPPPIGSASSIDALEIERRHHFRARQCQDQLLGTRRTTSRSIATRRRAQCRNRRRSARWPDIRCSGSIFPTRCSRGRASFTICTLPGMLHGRVLRPEISRATLTELERRRRARRRRSRRDRARRQFRRRRQRNRGTAPKPRSRRLRKGATWSAGEAAAR